LLQHRFVTVQVGQQGAIDLEDGPGRETPLPEVLPLGQSRDVEASIAFVAVGRKCARIHLGRGGGEKRARWENG
jgi:hypothetical protein